MTGHAPRCLTSSMRSSVLGDTGPKTKREGNLSMMVFQPSVLPWPRSISSRMVSRRLTTLAMRNSCTKRMKASS